MRSLLLIPAICFLFPHAAHSQWAGHIIDDGSKGADGVRLADVNGDGLLDIVTGWEEGGAIRICLNPGHARAKEKWKVIPIASIGDPEDAVFADLDGDGAIDVVSSSEGKTRAIHFHFAPESARYDQPQAWKTLSLPAAQGNQWMFCTPAQIDYRHGLDLVCGAKGNGAQLGWFQAPANPRNPNDWTWHPLRDVGWTMSILVTDMDADGHPDILFSNRRGDKRGVFWLQHPGGDGTGIWKEHTIGATGREAMFLAHGDLDGDGLNDVVVAARPADLLFLRRLDRTGLRWSSHVIPMPKEAGSAKAVAIGDINRDGKPDLVFTCENAQNRPGVMWMEYSTSPANPAWTSHDIAGPRGIKYDLAELIDLDGDGDLDVLTTEERELNAVLWYENPTR